MEAVSLVSRLILPSVLLALSVALFGVFQRLFPYVAMNLALEQARDGIPAGMWYAAAQDAGSISSGFLAILCAAWLLCRLAKILKLRKGKLHEK